MKNGELFSPGVAQGLQQCKHKVLLASNKLEVLSIYSCTTACPLILCQMSLRRLDLKLNIPHRNDFSKKNRATGAATYGSLQSMLQSCAPAKCTHHRQFPVYNVLISLNCPWMEHYISGQSFCTCGRHSTGLLCQRECLDTGFKVEQ